MDGNRSRSTVMAAVAFVVIFLLRLAIEDPDEGVIFLMVLPIALLAVDHGVKGGLLGAALATVAMIAWIVVDDVNVGAVGVITRVVCFIAAGAGVGRLAEQRDQRAARLMELELKGQRHDAAMEMNEKVLQSLAVAKMGLEMGDAERAKEALEDALRSTRSLVSEGVETTAGSFRSTDPPTT